MASRSLKPYLAPLYFTRDSHQEFSFGSVKRIICKHLPSLRLSNRFVRLTWWLIAVAIGNIAWWGTISLNGLRDQRLNRSLVLDYSDTSSNSNVFNMQPGSITLSIHFYFRDSKDSHTWKHFKQYKIYLKTVLDINTSTVWRRMWILGMLRTCELLSEWYAWIDWQIRPN